MAITKSERDRNLPAQKKTYNTRKIEYGFIDESNNNILNGIENFNIDQFAQQAAVYFNQPEKYSSFVTGWIYRWRDRREKKAVEGLTEYLISLRNAAISINDLQQQIIKSKILFRIQAQLEIQRLEQQLEIDFQKRELEIDKLKLERLKVGLYSDLLRDIHANKEYDDLQKLFITYFDPTNNQGDATIFTDNMFVNSKSDKGSNSTFENLLNTALLKIIKNL